MARSDGVLEGSQIGPDGKPLQWDRCNVCGQRFPNWPTLRDHKRNHTTEEIDARTIGTLKHENW